MSSSPVQQHQAHSHRLTHSHSCMCIHIHAVHPHLHTHTYRPMSCLHADKPGISHNCALTPLVHSHPHAHSHVHIHMQLSWFEFHCLSWLWACRPRSCARPRPGSGDPLPPTQPPVRVTLNTVLSISGSQSLKMIASLCQVCLTCCYLKLEAA